MHAVGSVGGGSGSGGGRAGRAGGRSPRAYKSSKADNDDGKRGGCGGDDEKAGMGPVYRIGKHKFRLDGKDGKTLDDIIEVSAEGLGTECRVSHLVAVLGWVDLDLGIPWLVGCYCKYLWSRQYGLTSQI